MKVNLRLCAAADSRHLLPLRPAIRFVRARPPAEARWRAPTTANGDYPRQSGVGCNGPYRSRMNASPASAILTRPDALGPVQVQHVALK